MSSVQCSLSFITSFFEGMVFQSRNFYENNMILWYYQIRPKVVLKVHGACMDGCDSQSKYKNITLTKNKSLLFFRAVYHRKEQVIPHPVIAAILDVILNILQR